MDRHSVLSFLLVPSRFKVIRLQFGIAVQSFLFFLYYPSIHRVFRLSFISISRSSLVPFHSLGSSVAVSQFFSCLLSFFISLCVHHLVKLRVGPAGASSLPDLNYLIHQTGVLKAILAQLENVGSARKPLRLTSPTATARASYPCQLAAATSTRSASVT
jgi:hypothetical protein